jgi:signal transduction histidine kinase
VGEFHSSPIRKGEQIIGARGVIRDITDRKHAEEERERILKDLQIKNAEIAQIAYAFSHELRSPLVTLMGFTGRLRKDAEQKYLDEMERDLKVIESTVTKMEHIFKDTLELTRSGTARNLQEDVPFGEIVEEALEQTAEQIKSSGVEVSVATDFPSVYVDRMRIAGVLVNLIGNSITFMGEQSQPKMVIGSRAEEEETVFFVKDNGIGIDPNQHEKVFELFYRGDNRGVRV